VGWFTYVWLSFSTVIHRKVKLGMPYCDNVSVLSTSFCVGEACTYHSLFGSHLTRRIRNYLTENVMSTSAQFLKYNNLIAQLMPFSQLRDSRMLTSDVTIHVILLRHLLSTPAHWTNKIAGHFLFVAVVLLAPFMGDALVLLRPFVPFDIFVEIFTRAQRYVAESAVIRFGMSFIVCSVLVSILLL